MLIEFPPRHINTDEQVLHKRTQGWSQTADPHGHRGRCGYVHPRPPQVSQTKEGGQLGINKNANVQRCFCNHDATPTGFAFSVVRYLLFAPHQDQGHQRARGADVID